MSNAARNSDEGFDCDVCGEWHDTRPFEVLMKKPEPAAAPIPDDETPGAFGPGFVYNPAVFGKPDAAITRDSIRERARQLERAGAFHVQAYALAVDEAVDALIDENDRLRRYVSVVASAMPREALLEIEKEFTRA